MNKQDILNIIKENPQMSYDKLKSQAITIGLPMDLFEEAWKEFSGGISSKINISDDPNIEEVEVEIVSNKNRKRSLQLMIFPSLLVPIILMLYVLTFILSMLG